MLLGLKSNAQGGDTIPDLSAQPAYEESIEYLLENAGSEGESEIPADLTLKKIDINTATYDDWAQPGLLTPSQINAIIQHREKHGDFLSLYELKAVEGMTESTLQQIWPYLYLKPNVANNALPSCKHELISYWKSMPDNDTSQQYLGSKFKLRNSYSFESSPISFRFMTEKDEGESWFSRQIPTFDYVSATVEYRTNAFIRKIIAGDYTCQFGQGLAVWNRQDFSQNIYTANLCRIKSGINSHRTFEENNFFRGIAVAAQKNSWAFTCWGSIKYRDATVSRTDSNGRLLAVSHFQTSGIHATASQMLNRHSIREHVWGADAHCEWKNVVWGICGYQSIFAANYEPPSLPYLSYSFTGKRLWIASSYARLHSREAIFYAESAISNSPHNYAFIGGICYMPHPELTFNWLYRNYSPGYFSPYASAYTLNTSVSNEKGYCMVIHYQYWENYLTLVELDFAEFPWLRYRATSPSGKRIFLLQQEFTTSQLKASFRYRYSWSYGNMSDNSVPMVSRQHRTTLQLWQQIREDIKLHHRFDISLNPSMRGSKGMLLAQDIDWKLMNRLTLSASYALFSTDDWEARIYAYEKNIWRVYSSALYYGNGIRTALMLKGNVSRQLRCWLRYEITRYNGNSSNLSTEPKKSELSLQVYWHW